MFSKEVVAQNIATVGPLGYAPKAPGTVGSIPGLFIGALFGLLFSNEYISALSVILMLVILFLIAWWSIDVTESHWQSHDDKKIVIDEVVGMAIVVSFGSFIWWQYLVAFGLFRFFDIKKPWLVGYFDKNWDNSLGTLLDDVTAGILSFACFGIVNSIISLVL